MGKDTMPTPTPLAPSGAAATTTTSPLSSLPPPVSGASNKNVVSSRDDYPNASRALGQDDLFNLGDPPTLKRSWALLAELIDLLSDDYELNITDSANNSVTWVRVPKTSSDRSFPNSKEWLDIAIRVAGSKH